MAKREIDESVLQQYASLAKFYEASLANPETRQDVLKIQKKLNPKAVIPELDAQEPVNAALAEIRKELAEDRAARAKEKEEAEALAARKSLENKWMSGQAKARDLGYSDEGLKKLEEFMQENGVADHEIAMSHFEKINPRETPIASNANPFSNIFSPDMRKSDEMKGLFENHGDGWLNQQINATLGRRVA